MTQRNLNELRVLVVEDDAMVRRILVRALTQVCGVVQAAETGEQALQVLAQSSFDVIVSDLKMPGMNGLEVLRHARRAHPHTALVITTGFAEAGDEDTIRELKVTLLPKPFGNAQLVEALQRAVGPSGAA